MRSRSAGRVFAFDRNFPGHKIITAILDAGGHVVARAKSGLALPLAPDGWLSDGSRLSYLNAPSGKKSDRLHTISYAARKCSLITPPSTLRR